MKKTLLIALPLITLAGCYDGRPGMPGPVRECRAGAAQRFVGAPFRQGVARQAQRAAGARSVRVLYPGQAATMDYRADRLNIQVGERNIVRGVTCG